MQKKNKRMLEYKETYIKNVTNYLLWVKENYNVEIKGDDGQTFSIMPGKWYYRGQSCSDWDLKPSVFRDISPYKTSLDEHSLLANANLKLWSEISSLSYLERMIFFQHYGLSTRLLDVTFNPLVALYMACSDENHISCDGAVYCGYYVDAENLKISNATAKYVFEHQYQRVAVDIPHFASKEDVSIDDLKKPVFIMPPMVNPRIESQNGAFIMAPLLKDDKLDNAFIMNRDGLEYTNFFHEARAIITSSYKENILHDLSILGIDNSFIFKGTDALLKSIMMDEVYKSHQYGRIEG